MCSETDFTQEKVNFHATTGIPNSSSYCCCPPDDHLQEAGPSFWQSRKGYERCIFETLHNEIKCVWVSKYQISMKKDQNFRICLRSGPRWLTPPPYSLPDRNLFFTPSLCDVVNASVMMMIWEKEVQWILNSGPANARCPIEQLMNMSWWGWCWWAWWTWGCCWLLI